MPEPKPVSAAQLSAAAQVIERYNREVGHGDESANVGISPFMLRLEADRQSTSEAELYQQFHADMVAASEAELAEVQADHPELAEYRDFAAHLRHYAVLASISFGHRMLAAGWTKTAPVEADL